jgi:hypothetical protein
MQMSTNLLSGRCAIHAGVYWNKLALFGLAIEVFFESCNPLLHVSIDAVVA